MDELVQPTRVLGLVGPDLSAIPEGFYPLSMVLEASGACIDLARPDMIVGRHSEADIRLPLPDVSRRHCRFFFREGKWYVRDLKSLNGVFVNDLPVDEVPVQVGDRVRIGGFVFLLQPGAAPEMTMTHPESQTLLYRIFRAMPHAGGEMPQRKAS